jgi:predicted nuclease of restriction endonuclease-like (RecB) superfamily
MTKLSRADECTSANTDASLHLTDEYQALFKQLKERVALSRLKAARAVNQQLIELYWHIGKKILEKQEDKKWGEGLIDRLSHDLCHAFPETKGFSPVSLKRMRMFAQHYSQLEFRSQAVTQLPWGHIQLLLFRVKDTAIREWYAAQCLDNGWSRATLERHIKHDLFASQGSPANKATNFLTRLPAPQSSLAQDMVKNPYNFDFLGLHDEAHERDIERASIQHITQFMLELGKGFAFVGSRYLSVSMTKNFSLICYSITCI